MYNFEIVLDSWVDPYALQIWCHCCVVSIAQLFIAVMYSNLFWVMQLRSLALPFTAMEWALPPAPKVNASSQPSSSWRSSLFYKERPTIASTIAAANAPSVVPAGVSESGGSSGCL